VQPKLMGWDIGGAHVKVAFHDGASIVEVQQLACPLWKGVHELQKCIKTIQKHAEYEQYNHVVTMTGELVDHFDNREKGVLAIINEISNSLASNKVLYYAGKEGFLDSKTAIAEHAKVASANWLASASYAATKRKDALFVDIGSTTTDIVNIHDKEVHYFGYSDAERLIAKELVYFGVVRTPVFAICKSALVRGQQVPVINEYFSNSADVYRLTEDLSDHADISETLDGRDKSLLASATRLARMFANDAKEKELDIWRNIAKQIRDAQLQIIKDACRHQCLKKNVSLDTPIIGAGVGRFLVKDIAQQLGREYIDFDQLFNFESAKIGFSVGDCAPAASVAGLAASCSDLFGENR